MRKFYLKKAEKCICCGKSSKRFTEYEGKIICENCFLETVCKKFAQEKPYLAKKCRTKRSKLFKKRKSVGKYIYATNGIKIIYGGGCFN